MYPKKKKSPLPRPYSKLDRWMSSFMVSAAKARFVLHPYLVNLVLSCSVALEKEAHMPR